MTELQQIIESAFERRDTITPGSVDSATKAAILQAIELLENTYQSVVLSDVDLGTGASGVELMQHIAEHYPTLPRILMSGLPAEFLVARFGLAEHQPLLAKPFTIQQFDSAIRQATSLFQS